MERERPILISGNKYIIDKGFRNSGEVILLDVYGEYFCRVKSPDSDYAWDTMINRLSNVNQGVITTKDLNDIDNAKGL